MIDSAFQELDQAFEAFDLRVVTKSSRIGDECALRRTSSIATWRHSKVATRSSPSTVGSFQKESAGASCQILRDGFLSGRSGIFAVVSLLSVLSAPAEGATGAGASEPVGEECGAHAWASSGSSVDYVALEQPYEDDGDRMCVLVALSSFRSGHPKRVIGGAVTNEPTIVSLIVKVDQFSTFFKVLCTCSHSATRAILALQPPLLPDHPDHYLAHLPLFLPFNCLLALLQTPLTVNDCVSLFSSTRRAAVLAISRSGSCVLS